MNSLKNILTLLPPTWQPQPPLIDIEHARATSKFSNLLTDDFWAYHAITDGGEGRLGGLYLSLWSIQEMETLNPEYGFQEHMHELICAIGTADDAFIACDCRGGSTRWVAFPFGDFDLNEVCDVGVNFSELLDRFIKNQFPDSAKKLLLPNS